LHSDPNAGPKVFRNDRLEAGEFLIPVWSVTPLLQQRVFACRDIPSDLSSRTGSGLLAAGSGIRLEGLLAVLAMSRGGFSGQRFTGAD
jgi:hypothetical protein